MSIEIVTPPNSTDLVSLLSVKAELSISGTADDTVLQDLIQRATDEVHRRVGRPLYRAQYLEKTNGPLRDVRRLALSRYPIASLDAVTYADQAQTVSAFEIEDPEAGFLRNDFGFYRSRIDSLAWEFTYTAGYFLPGDDVSGSISASSIDNSFNSAASLFDRLLVAGDWILASGWSAAANNGYHRVVSAVPAKVIVASTLVDEGAGARGFILQNVPAGVRTATMELVKSMYGSRSREAGIREEQVGPITTKWGDVSTGTRREVDRLLSPFVTP